MDYKGGLQPCPCLTVVAGVPPLYELLSFTGKGLPDGNWEQVEEQVTNRTSENSLKHRDTLTT